MKSYLNKLLESGLFIALLTGALYFLTYLRIEGILAAYKLPDELIDISIPDIISTLSDLIYSFWPVLIVPAVGLVLARNVKDEALTSLIRLGILMLTFVVFSIALTGRFSADSLILVGIWLYACAEQAFKALRAGRGLPDFRSKWKAAEEADANRSEGMRAAEMIGRAATLIAIVYVLSASMMEHSGDAALTREWYFVAEDHENKLVVYQNDRQYVLMRREEDELLSEYEFVDCSDIGTLSHERTGKLELRVEDAAR